MRSWRCGRNGGIASKIRVNDPVDADKLEKACCVLPPYLTPLPTPPAMKRSDDNAAVEAYIKQGLRHELAFRCSTTSRWTRLLGKAKTVKGIAKEAIQKIDMIINALQGEQAKFRIFCRRIQMHPENNGVKGSVQQTSKNKFISSKIGLDRGSSNGPLTGWGPKTRHSKKSIK